VTRAGVLTGTPLGRSALLLVGADVAHALDHARQGRDLAAEVYTVGIAGWIALAVLLVLVARRHRLAAGYAGAVGLAVAVGFVAVHLAPHWSAVSDPYSAWDPDALSWALVALPPLAGLNLVAQAARARSRTRRSRRGRGRAAPASSTRA
jgi:apolipoprotein N-acyltransferase